MPSASSAFLCAAKKYLRSAGLQNVAAIGESLLILITVDCDGYIFSSFLANLFPFSDDMFILIVGGWWRSIVTIYDNDFTVQDHVREQKEVVHKYRTIFSLYTTIVNFI